MNVLASDNDIAHKETDDGESEDYEINEQN